MILFWVSFTPLMLVTGIALSAVDFFVPIPGALWPFLLPLPFFVFWFGVVRRGVVRRSKAGPSG